MQSDQQEEKQGGGEAAASGSTNNADSSMSTSIVVDPFPSPSDFPVAFRFHLLLDQFRHRQSERKRSMQQYMYYPPSTRNEAFAIHAHLHIAQLEKQNAELQRQNLELQLQNANQQRIIEQQQAEAMQPHGAGTKANTSKKRGLESAEKNGSQIETMAETTTTAASAFLSSPSIDELQGDQASKKQKCDDKAKSASNPSLSSIPAQQQSEQHHNQSTTSADVQLYPLTSSSSINTAATASTTPASHVSISVQLVMQFLELKDVGRRAARVCRIWRSAAASPFVWNDRTDFIDCPAKTPVSWSNSPIRRNVRTALIRVDQHKPWRPSLLDRLQTKLPHLTELKLESDVSSASLQVMRHSLWKRMRCISIHFGDIGDVRSTDSKLSWNEVAFGVSQCKQLTKLSLRQRTNVSVSTVQLAQLLIQLPLLEDLSLSTFESSCAPFPVLPVAYMSRLHSLKVDLLIGRVEQMCEHGNSTLTFLHKLDLTIVATHQDASKEEQAEAESAKQRAAANLGISATTTPNFYARRLTCLSRLSGLRHLTLHNHDVGISDPMSPLQFAQLMKPNAFKQLQSYSYDSFAYRKVLLSELEFDRPLLFPCLTSLHLRSYWTDQFDFLCRQVPNLCSLKIDSLSSPTQMTPADEEMLAWCRSPALRTLRFLHTIIVNPIHRSGLNAQALMDLHSLTDLPELNHVDIVCTCCLQTRSELNELMTLQEIQLPSLQPYLPSAIDRKSL